MEKFKVIIVEDVKLETEKEQKKSSVTKYPMPR